MKPALALALALTVALIAAGSSPAATKGIAVSGSAASGIIVTGSGATVGAGQGSVKGSGATSGGILYSVPPGGGTGLDAGVLIENPEIQHAVYKKKAEDDFSVAAKAKAAGDLETATRLFVAVAEMSKMHIDSPYPAQAYEELTVIADQAARELAVARSLLAGEDPAAGLAELKRITRVYSGLPAAKQAGVLTTQLATDPDFQATLRAARLAQDLKKAETLESRAADVRRASFTLSSTTTTTSAGAVSVAGKMLSDKEREALSMSLLAQAYEAYGRIVDQGGATDPAKAAAAARARLAQDKDLMNRLVQAQAERKGREYLGLAQNYFKAGLTDRAREYCRKILSECPEAPQAADAKALLDQMK